MMSSVMSIKIVAVIFVVLNLELLLSNYCEALAAKHAASVSGGCIENERHALIDLKASLVTDDTYILLPSWDRQSYDCCEWEGVVCNNQTGHVEMLDLNGNQYGPFQGEISTSLIELQHLKHLNLSFNMFSKSNIPELFGSLSNLRFLDLQDSYFGGRIPNDLARLSQLQYLDLSVNDLNSIIPHQLGNLSHLKYLDLSWNLLVGIIPHQLGSLSNLQQLHLGFNEGLKFHVKNNHFGGEWLSNLTLLTHLDLSDLSNLNSSHVWLQMTFKLPKIQELRLSQCDLSDIYLLSLPGSLLNFSTSLEILDFSSNAFSSSQKIFEWVFNATSNLIELDLGYNNFKNTIPYDLGNIGNPLERLDLSGNELQGGTLEPFGDICTLHSLSLAYNNLNEDISTILLKLSGCARYSLQELWLEGNQITGTFPDLSIFTSLITIDLSNNLLSGKVPVDAKFLPSKLEYLIFRFNSFEGGIPKSFSNLCSLRSLALSSNKLSEDLSVIIHNLSVGCAKYSLQKLDLGSNQIIGMVPNMSVFSSLQDLFLSNNLLNGRILKNSTFPNQLETLYLDSNNLKGVITDSHFNNMFKLKYLNLSYNSLALIFSENWVPHFQLSTIYLSTCILGPNFPKWLKNQKHLREVDISDAGILDVVPVWFWTQTTYMTFMNISYNNLAGTIPNLPVRFSEDFQAIMNSNQFEGSIPPFFRSATLLQMSMNKFLETNLFLCTNATVDRLQIIDLSKNQLSRQLPDCWSHLKALEYLDLSDNTLSGEVPSSIGSLHKLRVLILRNNSFTGKLPVSLKNCVELNVLDLGDNRFSGPIPYWLGQHLQMLSLRRNRFYGSLPHSLCYVRNIQLLDLSENNLSGRIFKCLKNFSAMSQNVSWNRIESTMLSYPIGFHSHLGYEGYDLVALLIWKGTKRLFKNNKLLLRSIDLSSNQLIGDIPEEIGNLIELVSLNLSNNNLTGEITSNIGRLTSLEVLDLSRNHFFGPIPPSLSQISFMSMLNLSDNNLSGSIPTGTQLQSFDASSYEGNVDLCGKPLDKKCPKDEEETHEESSPEDNKPIYLSVTLGFITGFWGLWGSLLLIRNWRHAYVLFLNNIIDTMYVFMVLECNKISKVAQKITGNL
ncbi:receptor protein EIX2 [Trifolium repens]|nr:receptor protein EIX2 [Trifolium repens]